MAKGLATKTPKLHSYGLRKYILSPYFIEEEIADSAGDLPARQKGSAGIV